MKFELYRLVSALIPCNLFYITLTRDPINSVPRTADRSQPAVSTVAL